MSTRKQTQTPTSLVGGTTLSKVDNVTTNIIDNTTTTTRTTASVINVPLQLAEVSLGKGEMGKTASSINPNLDKTELEFAIASSKSIQTRVTRSSPLLLNSPTNKKDQANALLELNELNNSESDEVTSAAPKRVNQIRGRKSLKEIKELKEQDKDDPKEEQHDQKELKEINETKANAKELKEAADAGTSASTSGNRLTRKSLFHNSSISVNTRVTRQHHTNHQTGSRSETPPARHKVTRAAGRSKISLTSASSSESSICKGKRSLDTRCYSTEEPLIKCIKTEAKDEPDYEDEEFLSTSQTTVTSSESAVGGTPVKFKQELAEESENECEHVVVTEASNSSAGTPSSGRSRYSKSGGGRKANNTRRKYYKIISLSPTPRSRRKTKASSPAASTITTESAKRPRVTSNSRSLLKSNVGANSSKRQRASSHLIDEDELSKDGSISSSTTDDITMCSIKSEVPPFTSELSRTESDAVISESYKESEAEEKSGTVDTDENIIHMEVDVDDDGLSVPTTNTSTVSSPSLSAVSSKSKKNFSLSPADLKREGINASEVNVKQFYKKGEFLENNLNIEEDPKLDTTVAQEVNTMNMDTLLEIGEAINPDDSLKEGSLRFEDEESPETKLLSQQKLTSSLLNEDENSSSLNFHPEEEYNLIDNDEPVLVINEDNVPEEELNGAKDDEFQDEEVTIDESECISMDNNASVNNDLAGAPFDDETDENFVTSKNEEAKDDGTEDMRSTKPSENFDNNVLDAQLEKLDGRSKEKPSKRRKTDETNNKINTSDNIINNMEISEMKFDKFPLSVAVVKAETFEMAEEKDKKLIKIDDDDQEAHTHTKTRSGLKSKDSDNVSLKCKNSDERNSWVPLNMEHDEETLREKERHLQHLGLVTHKAAEKRRIEVQQSSAANVEASKAAVAAATVQQPQSHYSKRIGKNNATHTANNNSITNNNNNNNNTSNGTSITSHPEYTGTLKTVIKLSRNSTGYAANGTTNRRKSPQTNSTSAAAVIGTGKEHHMQQQQQHRRQSLKMTFQKGRGRPPGTSNHDRYHHDGDRHGEDSYYTIQNENEETSNQHNTHSLAKTNTIISANNNNNNNKLVEQKEILIPEKASSFKFHPDRLCEDQCFYCSGTFGLYDTPCHVGQIKSKERQQKILASEEKLTVDNCLCDACFRHVDRRANAPSYRKRISASDNMGPSTSAAAALRAANETQGNANENNGTESTHASAAHKNDDEDNARECMVNDCKESSTHSLRRKCLRKNAKKFLLNFEMPASAAILWLCQTHYDAATRGLACVLCKRRLAKHYMYRVSDIDRLEKTLADMGIPVKLGSSRATCKLCRYFANLLTKPTAANKSAEKAEFIQNYRKRLLQFHNIHVDNNEPSEADEEDSNSAGVVEVPVTNITQKSPPATKPLTVPEDDSSATKNSLTPQESVNSMEIERNGNDAAAPARSALSVENTPEETMDRDYECTALNNDSSSNQSMDSSTKHSAAAPTDTQQMSKLKAILQSNTTATTVNAHAPGEKSNASADISTVLRANPNLSMRELFPGEEDLGLHFKVPFGTSNSQRTPEGWTRVDTFLQYDEPTRRLWEELQKPYGNQSSFLRHLILLEKYYRNGDLILSPNASSNASVYTQTVRQRLTSFDQGHSGGLQEAAVPVDASPTTTTQTASKARTCEPEIPTVEINEDDDDMEVNNTNDVDGDDDDDDVVETLDVEMTPVQKLSTSTSALPENKSKKHQQQQQQKQIQRSRSLSVDKITKQLNTQAVTIIARPKEQTTHSGGGGGGGVSKRTTPSPQKSLLKDNLVSSAVTSTCSSAQPNSTAGPNAAAVAVPCSTSMANSNNSRSILKCNLLGINKSVEIVPVNSNGTSTPTSCTATATTAPKAVPNLTPATNISAYLPAPTTMEMSKQHDLILGAAKKLVEAAVAQTKTNPTNNAPNLLSSPPELVSLQRRTTNQPVTIASNSRNSNNANTNTNANKRAHVIGKVVILPDTLTPQERMQSKSWRPTLMPVKDNQNLFSKNGPLYQTADGRRLPGLVQVQSGGKPFLISIFDYNRMCILRREKLMRDQMLKATKKRQEDKKHQQQTQSQQQHQQQQQQHQQQSHHHQQMAKSGLHHMNKNTSNQANLVSVTNRQQQQQQQQQHQQQVAQQQLLQLQLLQHQQGLLKAAANNNGINVSGGLNVSRYQPIAPKPSNAATTSVSATSVTGPTVVNVPPLSTSATFPTPMIPLLANVISNASNNCTSWLWNNFPDANQLLLNGVAGTAGGNVTVGGVGASTSASMPKLPHLLTNKSTAAVITTSASPSFTHANAIKQQQQQQQQQQQFLLSKIPKSLTVIPQHKLMNAPVSNATLGANINTANGNQIKE